MTVSPPVRVVVCDDHPVYRQGLQVLLAEVGGIEVVGEAPDGETAVKLVDELQPDVVVMDLHMPGISGVEATRRLLARNPDLGVLVLTMFTDDTSLLAALRAGARGYVVKDADHQKLATAIMLVAAGETIIGKEVSDRLGAALAASSGPRPFLELSDREYEVLQLMAQGLSNDTIASRLFLSPKTIRNNVSNILTKLGVETRVAAVARARDAGIGSPTPGSSPAEG